MIMAEVSVHKVSGRQQVMLKEGSANYRGGPEQDEQDNIIKKTALVFCFCFSCLAHVDVVIHSFCCSVFC